MTDIAPRDNPPASQALVSEIRQLIVVRDRNEAVAAVARANTRVAQR